MPSSRPLYAVPHIKLLRQIDAVVADSPAALNRAVALDSKIMGDAAKISQEYVDLVSLATRLTMAAMEITVKSADDLSNVDASDVKIFVKDVGGPSGSRCVVRS